MSFIVATLYIICILIVVVIIIMTKNKDRAKLQLLAITLKLLLQKRYLDVYPVMKQKESLIESE